MDSQRLSAGLFIVAFALVVLGAIISVPGLYGTQDVNERLEIVEAYRTRWLTTQALVGLFTLLTAVAFGFLASTLQKPGWSWLPLLGTLVIIGGTLSGLYFVYQQTISPRVVYSGGFQLLENIAYWLWIAGVFIFGVAFLQSGLPTWIGYLSAGGALVYAVFVLVTGAGFITPSLVALLGLIIGIVLLRQ